MNAERADDIKVLSEIFLSKKTQVVLIMMNPQ